MHKPKQKAPIQFRSTDDLDDYLREQAKLACRSINQEVQYRLQQSRILDQQKAAKKGNVK